MQNINAEMKRRPTNYNKRIKENENTSLTKEDLTAVSIEKPAAPQHMGYGESIFLVAEIATIMLFITCSEYADHIHPSTTKTLAQTKDYIQTDYQTAINMHVMIFVGFGFAMTGVRTLAWSNISFVFVCSVWAIQWAVLSLGFWSQVFGDQPMWNKIPINLQSLIVGDFGAGVAMIMYGGILGRVNF